MNFTGFVCEYNPFHRGHLDHLDFSRGTGGPVLAVMSGCFVQRGEPAVYDPWIRAKAAVEAGCDLVLLLPAFYALQPAEWFARGAMSLLARSRAERVTFGSPVTDTDTLSSLARILEEEPPEYSSALGAALKEGLPWPAAAQKALLTVYPDREASIRTVLGSANATLGLHYLRALEKEGWKGEIGILHRPETSVSATEIRAHLRNGGTLPEGLVPAVMREAAADKRPVLPDPLGPLFAYLCGTKEAFRLPDDPEGLEARLRKAARSASSWEGILTEAKSKRHTRARLQRAVLHALLGVDADLCATLRAELPLFILPLAMNAKGAVLLSRIAEETDLPVVDRPAAFRPGTDALSALWDLESRAFDLYRLLSGGPAGQLFTRQAYRG